MVDLVIELAGTSRSTGLYFNHWTIPASNFRTGKFEFENLEVLFFIDSSVQFISKDQSFRIPEQFTDS
jgi:hypothetical protein